MTQLYYQNYALLTPVLAMIRLIPMFPSGVICNIIIALLVARVDGVILIGESAHKTNYTLLMLIQPLFSFWMLLYGCRCYFPSSHQPLVTVLGVRVPLVYSDRRRR